MKKKVKELEKNGVFHSQWSALMSQTRSKIGLAIVLLFVAAAVFAPLIAPNDPLLVDVSHKLEGPSSTYWLGTDQLGRCIASRLLWGGRNSLLYGAIVLVITLLVGVPIGLISGYVGGKTDLFFMRVIDIFMAMPSFIVALAIAGTLGASGKNLVLSMSFVYWAGYARLSRALTIQVKEQNYMKSRRVRPHTHYFQTCSQKHCPFHHRSGHNGNRNYYLGYCRIFFYRTWRTAAYTGVGNYAKRQ